MFGKDIGGYCNKRFPEKTGIASNDDASPRGFQTAYVTGDADHGASNIFEGEFIGHDGAPTGSAELDLSFHNFSSLTAEIEAVSIKIDRSRLFAV